ncbi:MAG: hypothetical protein HYS39_02415 [Proteobacteria bacterium]|nr:hypothetical protein [Pseudomonadota bacterium]
MKEHREMLNYYYQICHVHANRIQKALDEINLPLTVEKITAMTIHELGMTNF